MNGGGDKAVLSVKSEPVKLLPGEYQGQIRFGFTTATYFLPRAVPVKVEVITWWEQYGPYVLWAVVTLLAVAMVAVAGYLYVWFKARGPIPIRLVYHPSDGEPQFSPRAFIAVNESFPFGGPGQKVSVAGVLGYAGRIKRANVDTWELELRGVGTADGTVVEYRMGSSFEVPGVEGFFAFRREYEEVAAPQTDASGAAVAGTGGRGTSDPGW